MAKSKHEKELARAKKKKDARRREEVRRQSSAAMLSEIEDFVDGNMSAASTARAIHAALNVAYVPTPSSTYVRLKGMLSKSTLQRVEDLADAGIQLRQTEEPPWGPPPINVALVQSTDDVTFKSEPVSHLVQKCRGFTTELASELLDLYQDAEIVLLVTTLTTFTQHLVVGRSRDGDEFAAVVHEGEWHHLADSRLARRFQLKQESFAGSELGEKYKAPDFHAGVLERVMQFQGHADLAVPGVFDGGEEAENEIFEKILSDTESVILSSACRTTGHLIQLAELLGQQRREFEDKLLHLASDVGGRFIEAVREASEKISVSAEDRLIDASPPPFREAPSKPETPLKPVAIQTPKPQPAAPPKPSLKRRLAALLVPA